MNDMYRPQPPGEAASDDLLARYRKGANMFVSPGHAILASGGAAMQPVESAALASEAVAFQRAARRAGNPGLLLGAIPFQPHAPAHLFIPARFEKVAGNQLVRTPPASGTANDERYQTVCSPSPQQYERNVAEAIARIRAGAFDKVVLSRSLNIDTRIDLPALLRRLACRNTRGYTYAIELAAQDTPSRTLIGASPELLVTRRGPRVVSNPLAGSIPRSPDPVEDARRAENLLHSKKDRHEHAFVADAVAAALRPYCNELIVPAEPSLVSTETMWHLSSEIKGNLADPNTTSLELALALHPTPAVCGYPTTNARAFIDEVEGFDRGLFTGLVGWCGANGDGEWAVTIRCAVVDEQSATLYAGAGIVAGSDPALELAETSAKLRTMLRAMGLEAVLEALS